MPAAPAAAPAAGPGGASLGELYTKCVQMVNENKISTKNAFDLKLIDHMDDIVDSFMGGSKQKSKAAESKPSGNSKSKQAQNGLTAPRAEEDEVEERRFLEASCTIEASARIYACRVDCVHTDTYRVLGGLSSADMDEEEEGKEGEDGGKAAKRRRIVGVNTLERNEKNIVQQNIEADEQSDPMFRRMAAAFDAGGAKGLLLSHLPIAEDLSLVFNGDVPLTRASQQGAPMFKAAPVLTVGEIGLGAPEAALEKLTGTRLCPEIDQFRRQLYGAVSNDLVLPAQLDRLLTTAAPAGAGEAPAAAPAALAASQQLYAPLEDGADDAGAVDAFDQELGVGDDGMMAIPDPEPMDAGASALPIADAEGAFGGAASSAAAPAGPPRSESAIAFDELFDKFCGGGVGSQFAYFDECWSRQGAARGDAASAAPHLDALTDGAPVDGQLVPAGAGAPGDIAGAGRQKGVKRPLFDLSGVQQPAKRIETEPAHKHQLTEKQAQWQLHKDTPPYMIDRITMPSWPSFSKCDFACLGLRPHLQLKLEKKANPAGEGFHDLFSTVVVENSDAFPWLASESRLGGRSGADGGDGDAGAGRGMDAGEDGEEDFDGSGLPAHLDVDPQDLFLRPGDTVIPGGGDLPGGDLGDGFDGPEDAGAGLEVDFDLADQPATVGGEMISYSRNSKFVDVKLVKKHLWDCMSHDIATIQAEDEKAQTATSFQGLVHRIVQRMPKAECENLSVQVCFICALHLCNEKGLEFKTDPGRPLLDFDVVGPALPSATQPAKKAAAKGA
eukprot:TRINITY_DN63205_c0_g1_i1.p1 TRINITY_DN63205_c0_g1~~TRINITY_DN63205_c0_g1_i1.p1  ORF type:complete len:782 (-),score=230.73 TRINITY_DN63205_c0_g1_i1:132-2477(-)